MITSGANTANIDYRAVLRSEWLMDCPKTGRQLDVLVCMKALPNQSALSDALLDVSLRTNTLLDQSTQTLDFDDKNSQLLSSKVDFIKN